MTRFHCSICAVFGPILPIDFGPPGTEREQITALCNHVMAVHHGGPTDAWDMALQTYPVAAAEWQQEVLDNPPLF